MIYVKQSTAVALLIGPFLDETDGKTPETALTIAQADVRLSKNGGNMAQKGEATSCTHDELGYYTCPLSTTDTGTLGFLKLMVHESGALPVWVDVEVLTANVYDTMFSTDQLDINVTHVAGTSQTGNDNGADINAILEDTGTTIPGTITTIDGNVDSILVDTSTTIPGTIATVDVNVDSILADTGITIPAQISGLNNLSSGEANAACDTALTDYDAATGTELAAIYAKIDTIEGNVDSILTDTGVTLPASIATVDGNVDSILTDTGTTLPAQLSGLNNVSTAEVNAQVLDVLNVDTYAEPGQGIPPASPTIRQMLHYLYKMLRNKKEQTATVLSLYDDAGTTVDQKASVSDDGTTFTKGEIVTGP